MLGLLLTLAACAAERPSAEPGSEPTQATGGQTTDAGQEPTGSTESQQPPSTSTTSDRPIAPDFTLSLGGGGSYTLSEGTKPVYMIFWAEW